MRSKYPVTTVVFWYSGEQDDRLAKAEDESFWPHVGFWLLFIGMIFAFAACGAR